MQDAVIIGAGQAGPFLAARLAGAGQKVTLVDKRALGGTCVNDGCTPTKTLVASARIAYTAREAARWGVVVGDVRVDMKAVRARKDTVVAASRDGLDAWLGSMPGLTLVRDAARFVSPNAVEAGGRRIEGKRFFINTGAHPVVPAAPGLEEVCLTNEDVMDLDEAPEHLVVVGSSFVALEFAQIYRRFGSRVTVLARSGRVLTHEDEAVADVVTEVFVREGIEVRTGATVARAEKTAAGVRVHVARGGVIEPLDASHVLVAAGRAPNTAGLGLEAAGVTVDAAGYIPVNDVLQTNVEHIWALGDVNRRGAFTHTSYNDYEVAAANLLDGAHRSVASRIPVSCMFVDPPLGRVGMSEREARASGKKILKGLRPMTRVSRASERGETDGFLQILVDAETSKIVGATLLGVEADEAVHVIAAFMATGAPYTVLQQTVLSHPTVSELIPTVLGELEPLA